MIKSVKNGKRIWLDKKLTVVNNGTQIPSNTGSKRARSKPKGGVPGSEMAKASQSNMIKVRLPSPIISPRTFSEGASNWNRPRFWNGKNLGALALVCAIMHRADLHGEIVGHVNGLYVG